MAENRYFQWVVGEKKGQILVFDYVESEDGINYLVFKDKSRINENFVAQINQTDLTAKMMAEIDHPTNCWKFDVKIVGEDTNRTETDWESQIKYDVPSVTEIASDGQKLPTKKKVITLIPPKPTAPTHSVFGAIKRSMEVLPPPPSKLFNEEGYEEPQYVHANTIDKTMFQRTSDPVYILMSKAKKIDSEITMGMVVSLPPKSLFDIAKQSFDEGDEKFIRYIVDEITVEQIKEALKLAIREMYEDTVKNDGSLMI